MVNIWENVGAVAEARRFAAVWGVQGTVPLDEPGQ